MGTVETCHAYTNFSLVKLRQVFIPTLESVSTELVRKRFRKAKDYESAYSEALKASREVGDAVKNTSPTGESSLKQFNTFLLFFHEITIIKYFYIRVLLKI